MLSVSAMSDPVNSTGSKINLGTYGNFTAKHWNITEKNKCTMSGKRGTIGKH